MANNAVKGEVNGQMLDDFDIECTLPRQGKPCTLERFQDLNEAEQIVNFKQNEIQKYGILQDIQINPQQYFNFNFNASDYFVFMIKYNLMRAERQVIEQEYAKYLKKKNINLPE